MRWLKVFLALSAIAPTPALSTIRALFVGINTYEYSTSDNFHTGFRNLRGAVGDVGRIKAALRDAYAFDLDTDAKDGCASSNPVSTTLTDSCATRDAILTALNARIDESIKGDTVVFYFAGHGSFIANTLNMDQASGQDATTLPYDARGPNDDHIVEILDREFQAIRIRANNRGVNIVTMFDSCFSDTATIVGGSNNRRFFQGPEGEARSAEPFTFGGAVKIPAAPVAIPGGGYWVHFAAADEFEAAHEVPGEGGPETRQGVFTTALAATLRAMPHATFDDIATEVRNRVIENGYRLQTPQAHGRLDATLGNEPRVATLFPARATPSGAELQAGRLSSVTSGSTFALFADSTSATAEKAVPVATGTIDAVEPFNATLRLDAPLPNPAPDRLVARELRHAFGTSPIRLRIDTIKPKARKTIARKLAGSSTAVVAEPAQYVVATVDFKDKYAVLMSPDRYQLAKLGALSDPGFDSILNATLEKLGHIDALFALRTNPSTAGLSFCIDNDVDYDAYTCPIGRGPKRVRAIVAGKPAKVTVMQTAAVPRFVYVFVIEPGLTIRQIMPEPGLDDLPIASGKPHTKATVLTATGPYRFLILASTEPIKGIGPDIAGVTATPRRSGSWTAIVVDRSVKDEHEP